MLTETAVEGLSEVDKATVTAELFSWVEDGPPRQNRRPLFGAPQFEDRLSSGFPSGLLCGSLRAGRSVEHRDRIR